MRHSVSDTVPQMLTEDVRLPTVAWSAAESALTVLSISESTASNGIETSEKSRNTNWNIFQGTVVRSCEIASRLLRKLRSISQKKADLTTSLASSSFSSVGVHSGKFF